MRPFDIREYFQDLGNGWRINTITGSVFYKNEEVIINRGSVRKVLAAFLKKKSGFKIFSFLKRNFDLAEEGHEREYNTASWVKAMQLAVERILNKYGFSIEVANGSSNKKTEWSLCRVNK